MERVSKQDGLAPNIEIDTHPSWYKLAINESSSSWDDPREAHGNTGMDPHSVVNHSLEIFQLCDFCECDILLVAESFSNLLDQYLVCMWVVGDIVND